MAIEKDDRICITRCSHMRYSHADLELTTTFLKDFGMEPVKTSEDGKTIWFAGSGVDPYVYVATKSESGTPEYQGGAFTAGSRDDLVKAAERLPNAKGPFKLDGPGGGEMVSATDPDGLPFHLVYGIEEREDKDPGLTRINNFPLEKPRKGEFLRFEAQPAIVHKLGHFGLLVSNYKKTLDFYMKHFTLTPSDILHTPDETDVAAFLHFDLGETFVDHHAFFFSENSKRTGVHHCSFEVQDYDTQMIGHQWLESKGYTPCWGVGRHILGSQVFDYWFQPEGKFMIEHYADSDQVNHKNPSGRLPASDEALAVWGPATPDGFLD